MVNDSFDRPGRNYPGSEGWQLEQRHEERRMLLMERRTQLISQRLSLLELRKRLLHRRDRLWPRDGAPLSQESAAHGDPESLRKLGEEKEKHARDY